MKKSLVIFSLLLGVCLLVQGFSKDLDVKAAENQKTKLAVIVLSNSVDPTDFTFKFKNRIWFKEKVPQIMEKIISERFTPEKYNLVPNDLLSGSLKKYGFDLDYMDMPSRDELSQIAKNANVDSILVVELTTFGWSRRSNINLYFYVAVNCRAINLTNGQYITRKINYEGPEYRFKNAFPKDEDYINVFTEPISAAMALAFKDLPF